MPEKNEKFAMFYTRWMHTKCDKW